MGTDFTEQINYTSQIDSTPSIKLETGRLRVSYSYLPLCWFHMPNEDCSTVYLKTNNQNDYSAPKYFCLKWILFKFSNLVWPPEAS